MKHLYFVRHGESEWNVQRIYAGTSETPLTALGRQQATAAGEALKKQNIQIDHIISSPLSRAHDTAKLIAKQIDFPAKRIELNSLFIERNFGSLEGKSWDLNVDGFVDVETADNILERARLALEFLESLPYDDILVVAHGSIGRALRHHVMVDFPYHNVVHIENAQVLKFI
jgi:probable phosphoglycerate mutase